MKINKKFWLLVTLAVIAAVCGGYYGWHTTHFAKNTVVQGVNIGKLSYKNADSKISSELKEPEFTLKDPQTKEIIYQGKLKIAASHAYRDELKNLLHQRRTHPFSTKPEAAKKASIYDKKAAVDNLNSQKAQITQAIAQANQKRTAPQNAQITLANGQATFKKAVSGNQIDPTATINNLAKQLDPNNEPKQNVSIILKKPTWYGEDEYQKITKILKQNFKYTVMGKTETTPVKNVLTEGTINESGSNLNMNPSYNYIRNLNQKYSLSGSQKTDFTTAQGQNVSFDNSQGTLGWKIQEYNEGRYLQGQLLAGKLTIPAKNIDNSDQKFDKSDLDAIKNQNHIEVDLTNEQLYLVENNKVVQTAPVNTGSPKVNIATPTGYYYIKWRKAPMTMRGTEKDGTKYSSYVPQAMDLTDDGIFIHSAPWVSKTILGTPSARYDHGSNGCINVAPADMEKLFDRSHQGMPVIVYGDGLAS
ncbi:L,D-transpeptidase family protein [Ligilactobacillus acidipiscis]|uniref:L,D-transpeptidase family protein n=1 Tax=Ligilactobacillus acidipiscis TaxID=89059 RepID=UPI002FDAAED4